MRSQPELTSLGFQTIGCALLLLFVGCSYGMDETVVEVTDKPAHVGSFRLGDTYTMTVDALVTGGKPMRVSLLAPGNETRLLRAGTKLKVGQSYRMSGANYSYVKVAATVLDGELMGSELDITEICAMSGQVSLGGKSVTGPNPAYLKKLAN